MKIDTNVPIPERIRGKRGSQFDALVSQMKPGDSVEFPWVKDENGNVRRVGKSTNKYSKGGQQFKTYLAKKKIKSVSRSSETGLRIWLI
tara:strand:+ start:493 stop:759 length:267 start_codon:yes stop_codon:yes gene_type:complete